jgi:phosphatidylserine decarboxylase
MELHTIGFCTLIFNGVCFFLIAFSPFSFFSHDFIDVLFFFITQILRYYRSLSEFFTRSIKDDCRTIAPDCVVSPCDGRVLHFGLVTSETHLEQVKGVTYSLESFLGPKWRNEEPASSSSSYIDSLKQKKEGTSLFHCIIYLAPGDYHRFHSPTSWHPNIRRHFHGELLSVSPKVANLVPGLFCINERAAYIGEWEHGFFSFTAVGKYDDKSYKIRRSYDR